MSISTQRRYSATELRSGKERWDLKKLGIKMNRWPATIPRALTILGLLLIVSSLWLMVSPDWPVPTRIKLSEYITLLFVVVGFAIGYQHWRDVRLEASVEKYYERLDMSNKRIHEIYKSRRGVAGPSYDTGHLPIGNNEPDILHDGLSPEAMWVYTELDTLEYLFAKYELGYVSRTLLQRVLNNIATRCAYIPLFGETARAAVNPSNGAGFREVTRNVATCIVEAFPFKETAARKTHSDGKT